MALPPPVQKTPAIDVTLTANVVVMDVNERPIPASSRILLDENSAVGTLVGYPVVVRDQDVDKPGSVQSIAFSIAPGAGGVLPPFVIDPVSGQISVRLNVLNFEAVSVYNLTVTATDNGVPALAANATVTVVLRYGWHALCADKP